MAKERQEDFPTFADLRRYTYGEGREQARASNPEVWQRHFSEVDADAEWEALLATAAAQERRPYGEGSLWEGEEERWRRSQRREGKLAHKTSSEGDTPWWMKELDEYRQPDATPSWSPFVGDKTPCQQKPQECEPRDIRHVVWDADDTIWDIGPYGGIASTCHGPYSRPDPDVLACEPSLTTVALKAQMRWTLNGLKAKGIGSSIVSLNDPGSVPEILDELELLDQFTHVSSNWDPKARRVAAIARKTGVPASQIIFVDDNSYNVQSVRDETGALGLVMGQDIKSPDEVFRYIKGAETK